MRRVDVPMPLLVLAAQQTGLVSTAQCDRDGLGRYRRHRLVASGGARVATRGVLDLGPVLAEVGLAADGPDERRRRSAYLALLTHGPAAVAVGQCALAMHGVEGLPLSVPAEVALPAGMGREARDGVAVRRFAASMPTVTVGSFRVAAPVCALAQAICELDRGHAIAVLDSALQRGVVGPGDLDEVARLARGRRGAARLHGWWQLVDGRAQSPLETRARLQCVDAGIPPDDLQVPVRDASGRIVARGDLGWKLRRGRWLLVEIDGAGPHSAPDALFEDRRRQNAVVATGAVDMMRFTARDLKRSGLLPAAVGAHRAADARRSFDRAAP